MINDSRILFDIFPQIWLSIDVKSSKITKSFLKKTAQKNNLGFMKLEKNRSSWLSTQSNS